VSATPALLSGCRGVVVGVSGENSLGFQIAKDLSALGAEVAATYRPARREACAPLLEAAGVAQHAALEATDEASIEVAFRQIGRAFGRFDFLVHTCVHVPDGLLLRPLLSVSRAEFSAVLDASAYSLIALCRQGEPWLAKSLHPRVVTLTSASAVRLTPGYHVAGIAKAALGAALLYLAGELGPHGVLCNAVAFSLIDTEGARRAVGAKNAVATREFLRRRAPTRREVEPGHVSSAVAHFASPLCQNVTGEVLMVDGGHSRVYL
jgi:enoyl-[acyl-carrier protein] reductase I